MPPVYLDHHATTPCDPAVAEAMAPWFAGWFGNPASTHHLYGQRAAAAVQVARERIAASIGAEPDAIVLTSGATEADNLAILGLADAHTGPRHLVVSALEHRAVLDPARALQARGWTLTELRPGPDGRHHPDDVAAALRPDTALVSIHAANHEVGVLQPIAEIAARCRAAGVPLHTDAAQAWGKIPLDVGALGVDLLSLSAHKACGPQGIGALWIRRRGRPRIPITARQLGGAQERGLRSGTVPVALAVGFGVAAERVTADLLSGEPARLTALRDRMLAALSTLPGVTVRGSREHRLPNNVHITVEGCSSAALLAALRHHVACSAGSACSSGDARPSPVLLALGLSPEEAAGALRFGLGRVTTDQDVEQALDALVRIIPTVQASREPARSS